MHEFPPIDGFYDVARRVTSMTTNAAPREGTGRSSTVRYQGTVKLSGVNRGVVCGPEWLTPQDQEGRPYGQKCDQFRFDMFAWHPLPGQAIREIEKVIREHYQLPDNALITLYGGFVGPGIRLPRRRDFGVDRLRVWTWVLFAARICIGEEIRYVHALPSLGDDHDQWGIYTIVDGPQWDLTVDFSDAESRQAALELACEATLQVENECPWAKRFQRVGFGEGIVWAPVGEHSGDVSLSFATKGLRNKVTRSQNKRRSLAPEVVPEIEAFVRFAVTERRLRDGLAAIVDMGHRLEECSVSAFLRWLCQDVQAEHGPELRACLLEWNHVSQAVAKEGRRFFMAHID